ncbi:RidA family protein [Nocardia ignorata]|uniref:RidA family protein n=1 Tax=Nocardia ignorata TaxID=145285 RepID=UPI00363D8CE7
MGTGSRHVHVSGQVSRLADGTPVAPGDLAGQVAQALRNTAVGLAGAGATFADVLRLTFYVTGWTPDQAGAFTSLIGVDALLEADMMVELEATAIVD